MAALALLVAGCGAERGQGLPLDLEQDVAFKRLRYPKAGLSLSVPEPLTLVRRRPPGVFRASGAGWYVAGFAYRRKEQLPRNGRELAAARRRLVREVRRRDRRFRLARARSLRVAGVRGVELVGEQPIARARLRIRSLHLYRRSAEYVIEMVAPERRFARLNRAAFDRIARSVRVSGRVQRNRD